ncbi:Bug family tripartite tricarboxylate transporter substrate binding protein [Paracraurococcus ruber]|uniref:N-acyl-D-aspartate deacylase n=1 Tax=Paracraurococcus ruber TaxID=77675 RepID=A0ABS1D1R3_9PROT|nr:tripartite tricarboxylate transporter substrate binding protein [Paracraurococcus ruber]MBK1660232.1 N-acyl-D-aspartate deacylase [Paracraurococcus ruber]TDG32292.1 tripartite tricarboxylate transporter substrate binding protein [Paracraurococcus ruber]
MQRRSVLTLAAAGLALPAVGRAQAPWPSQPVRLVVPFAAGGPTDIPARLFAEELSKILPQRVVVENRTGAGVVVGSEVVAKAPKDGHTLLYNTIAHSVLRALFPRLPFDPVADFQPVALLGVIPMVLLVNKDLPARSLQDLVALYRANPGKYDYGSSGNGGAVHLATELFLARAGGLAVNHVPYRGSAAGMPDLLSGRLAMFMDVAAGGLPYHTRGDARALGVSADRRLAQAPEVPTFAEAGIQGAESYTWHMVLAPAGTPAPVVQAINAAFNQVAAQDNVRRRLTDLTMDLRSDTTPETATRWLMDEIAKWEATIRQAGIRVE